MGWPLSYAARIFGDKCRAFDTTNALESTPTGTDCPSPQDFVSLARGFGPAADSSAWSRLGQSTTVTRSVRSVAFHRSGWRTRSSKIGPVRLHARDWANLRRHRRCRRTAVFGRTLYRSAAQQIGTVSVPVRRASYPWRGASARRRIHNLDRDERGRVNPADHAENTTCLLLVDRLRNSDTADVRRAPVRIWEDAALQCRR